MKFWNTLLLFQIHCSPDVDSCGVLMCEEGKFNFVMSCSYSRIKILCHASKVYIYLLSDPFERPGTES